MDIKRSLRALMKVLAVAVAAVSACSEQPVRPNPLETKLVNIPEDLDHVRTSCAEDDPPSENGVAGRGQETE